MIVITYLESEEERAWNVLQKLGLVLSESGNVEIPPPAQKDIPMRGNAETWESIHRHTTCCLCIFVDGLVEFQLDGIGSALFKSIKLQLLTSEDDFITFRPVFQFVS
jgi:hypothetical protein